jgi:hypothetical protein
MFTEADESAVFLATKMWARILIWSGADREVPGPAIGTWIDVHVKLHIGTDLARSLD